MAKKTYIHNVNNNKTIYSVLVFLLAVFMLIIPFYRGLFFRINYIPAIIFISFIFAVFSVYKLKIKKCELIDTYMDLSVLLIPVAYLISFFFAVNMKDAFDMFLLYCSYFMLYKITSSMSSEDDKYKNLFINVLIASTFTLSFASMLSVAGIVDINGAFNGKRLYGLYQYSNTTASVLGVGIILTLNKLIAEGNIKKAAVYQMILTALISSFIFTLSRGGYLVLAGVLLLNFLLTKARAKLKFIMSLIVAILSNSMLIYKFYIIAEEVVSQIWIYYVISVVVSAIIIYFIYSVKARIQLTVTDKIINAVLITTTVILVGVSFFLFFTKEPIEYRIEHQISEESSWVYKSINIFDLEPDSNYAIEFDVKASVESENSYRIMIRSFDSLDKSTQILNHTDTTDSEFMRKSLEFSTPEDTERIRIYFYNYETNSTTIYKNVVIKDSNDIIVINMEKLKYIPLAISDRIADINLETKSVSLRTYFTKDGLKIIKDYLITGAGGGAWKNLYRQYQSIPYNTTEVHNFYVQYGIEVGIIGLAVLLVVLILLIISMIKSIKFDSSYLFVYLAILVLLIHSTIDFNLSLPAVGYVLWLLIGITDSGSHTTIPEKLPRKYVSALAFALSLLIIIMSSSVYYGMKLGARGAKESNNKDLDKAIKLYEKASKFDRFNGAYRIDLAQILNNKFKNTKDRLYLDEIEKHIFDIKRYEPNNHQYTPIICNLYLSIGKFEEASKQADMKLKDEPLLSQSYTMKIDVDYQIARYYLENNKVKEASPYLEKILKLHDEFREVNTNLRAPLKFSESYSKKIEAASRTLELIKGETKK